MCVCLFPQWALFLSSLATAAADTPRATRPAVAAPRAVSLKNVKDGHPHHCCFLFKVAVPQAVATVAFSRWAAACPCYSNLHGDSCSL